MAPPPNPPNRYAAIIYAATDPINALAQLKTTFRVTNKNLYAMIERVCVFSRSFLLKDAENRIVQLNEEAVAPGNYFIVSMGRLPCFLVGHFLLKIGSVLPTPDSPLASDRRHLTTQTGSLRTTSFRKKIRARDRGCVLTGLMALEPDDDDYGMFEAAHIFPLALVEYWHSSEFTDEIDLLSPRASDHPINATINGMLLTRDAHYLFDAYGLSINPQVLITLFKSLLD